MKMKDSVLQRVYKMEEKNNIRYAKVSGTLYGWLRIIYIIAFVWSAFFELIVAAGFLLLSVSDGTLDKNAASIITVSGVIALTTAGLVFNCLRKPAVLSVLSLPAAVIGIVTFAQLLPDINGPLGISYKFYWAHLLPLLLLIICSIWMLVIALREKRTLTREYNSITADLYEKYSAQYESLTDEQWDSFLDNYNPFDPNLQFKKRDSAGPVTQDTEE